MNNDDYEDEAVIKRVREINPQSRDIAGQKAVGLIATVNRSIHPRNWSKENQLKKNAKVKKETELEEDKLLP